MSSKFSNNQINILGLGMPNLNVTPSLSPFSTPPSISSKSSYLRNISKISPKNLFRTGNQERRGTQRRRGRGASGRGARGRGERGTRRTRRGATRKNR